ncbi:MAG: acyl-CoA dehydrogenase [Myxococcales bacterium]|nr:acyl-CoA dehydrogenase [Myxococcales bacterium]MCB9704465.1 acyl-CoA dehydrogenase [Myxococcales bacterium]
MSTAATSHYKSNLRDIFFNLFEVLDIGSTSLGQGSFTSLDVDTVKSTLESLEEFVQRELSPSWVESDRVPLQFDGEGTVTLPPGLRRSILSVFESGWHMLEVPEHLGGVGAPPTVSWAAFELTAGANPCIAFYVFGTFIARVIDSLATESQRERFVRPLLENNWGGSMVLTEPDAGSDVGAGRTRARHVEGDLYEIEGVKRFITNGDFDAVDNIIHLVLARPEGAGPGTKGLSMFIVPKFWVNEDGSLGERNGAFCTNIEHKMGLKGSATCEMTFGEKIPCRGFLVGEVHDGIRQMFHVIEQARMAVGCKSMATLSTAYLNALEYAKIRVQGPDLLKATDKSAPRVTIIHHPDVRRMLLTQKAFAEGMRALVFYTASIQDRVHLEGGHGAKESREHDRLNDLLLPLVKGYCSHKGYELLAMSLQVFGGSGYCQDYPIEQYIRDQKIDTLYEGTTHIQALDLFFRKVARDGGETLRGLMQRIQATLAHLEAEGPEALVVEHQALTRALGDVQGIYGAMMGKIGDSLYHVGLQANRILFATAEIVIGWLLVRQAIVAHAALKALEEAGSTNLKELDFYRGKLAAVRFYCRNVLPEATLTRKMVEAGTLEVMDVPESAF